MSIPAQTFYRFLAVALVAFALTIPAPTVRADDFLDTLQVGATVYSNVTVITKTSEDIFYKHSYGFGNAKVRDLGRPVLLKLGYQLQPEEDERSVFDQSTQTMMESAVVTNLAADPRIQEAQALLNERLGDLLEQITPAVIYGFVASVIAVYLFYCFCGRQICMKVNPDEKLIPLIWIPVLRQVPLLRAAGIPWWWLVPSLLLPPLWFIVQIWWSFKIAQARSKSWVVGLLLLFPVTNILAYLYLAFSGTGKSVPASNSNVISLGAPPRRAVA